MQQITFFLIFSFFTIGENDSYNGEGVIEAREYLRPVGDTMLYRILMPAGYKSGKYPLVLCLHGAGGRGNDNQSRGTEAFKALSTPEIQLKHPAFLITPQCPAGERWIERNGITRQMEMVQEILSAVMDEFNIDHTRIYVTGQSMGGYGTWDIIM